MRTPRGAVVLLALAGGLLTVLAGGRVWLALTVPPGAAAGVDRVTVSGREAAAAAGALGLVAMAAAIVLATAGRVLRRTVAALLVVAGAGVVAVTATLPGTADRLLAEALARATGAATGLPAGAVPGLTVWPTVSAAGGVLFAVAGALALWRGRRWDGASRRFEAPDGRASAAPRAPAGSAASRDRAFDAWDALSAGGDPTVADGVRDAEGGRDPDGRP